MKKNLVIFFIFIIFYITRCYSNEQYINSHWSFDKISDVDIFGKHDAALINNLKKMYEQSEVNITEKVLTVNNHFLGDAVICSIKYNKIKKTPISYFYSEKTLNMYEQLFKNQRVPLSKIIYILSATNPDKNCPSPYDELIENNEYLVFMDQDYAIFLKNTKNVPDTTNNKSFINVYSQNCQEFNQGQNFDGSDVYECFFTKKKLSEIYGNLRGSANNGLVLKGDIPRNNIDYETNGSAVSYQWDAPQTLKISIKQGGQLFEYLFHEELSGTHLKITLYTGY